PGALPDPVRVSARGGSGNARRSAAPRGASHPRHQPDRHGRHPRPGPDPDRGVWLELMTALAPAELAEIAPEPSSPLRRKAPGALWALAIVLLLPAVTPIVYLLWTVLRPGGFDAGGVSVGRLIQLFGS